MCVNIIHNMDEFEWNFVLMVLLRTWLYLSFRASNVVALCQRCLVSDAIPTSLRDPSQTTTRSCG